MGTERGGERRGARGGAEKPWARKTGSHVPTMFRGRRQLSLKHYLNLHGLGNSPPAPPVLWAAILLGADRDYACGSSKQSKEEMERKKAGAKSLGASSHGWASRGFYLDFLNFTGFSTRYDLRWLQPAMGLEQGLSFQPKTKMG